MVKFPVNVSYNGLKLLLAVADPPTDFQIDAKDVDKGDVIVTWNRPDDSDVIGYQIFYQSVGEREVSVNVNNANTQQYIIYGLEIGIYSITIVSRSVDFPSQVVGPKVVTVGENCM